MSKTAIVAGSTGLVGGHLIHQLCQHDDYSNIIALVRSNPDTDWVGHPKVIVKHIDFDQLNTQLMDLNVDDIYCALGTTAKKTPNQQTYEKIDQDYPIELAKAGLAIGATFYGLVSAMGAKEGARVKYSHYKGVVENFLLQSGYQHVAIAQPSLLLGERNEFRFGESLASIATPLMPKSVRSIQGSDVAGALIRAANNGNSGVELLANKAMHGKAFS